MGAGEPQVDYWNTVGATKDFTHPLHGEWLAEFPGTARVLDYGCGYGRVTAELSERGFGRVSGVDLSPALIERGLRMRPGLDLTVIADPPRIDLPAGSFDVIVLFAVLTCVPGDEAQRALVTELGRLLAPGGLIYVSDLILQTDDRNRHRYDAHAQRTGAPYGVFATDDGAVCRHHDAGHLRGLFADFDLERERRLTVTTMNGHRSKAMQFLVRPRPVPARR